VPSQVQHTQSVLYTVAAQYLERDNQRVLHKIGVYGSVEDVDGSVVGCGREQWVSPVVRNRTESFRVVSVAWERIVNEPSHHDLFVCLCGSNLP
jgi:hypothetical protein